MDQLGELRLVRRVRAGEEAAFEELVRRHQRSVERLAARMLPDARDREEVCQDVFLTVFRKIDGFRGESRLSTWINTIAFRTCLNRLEGRDEPIPGSQLGADQEDGSWFPDGIAGEGPSPEKTAERSRLREVVESALGELRPEYRAVVTLYHLEGRTVAEVAETVDLPEGTVKSHLYRARKRLRDLLLEVADVEELRG